MKPKQYKERYLPFEVGKKYVVRSGESIFKITKIVLYKNHELGIDYFMGQYAGDNFVSMIHGKGLIPEVVSIFDLPDKSDWYICIVDGVRLPLRFNQPNSFWVGQDGKTYKPEIVKWFDF